MTEEVQDNAFEQGAERQAEAKPSAGRMLVEARERLGLSVADVARQLRLSQRQIEALEADDYAKLPAKTFLRGFIRNYAKLLQIDPEPLLAGCQDVQPQDQAIVVPMSRIEFGGKRRFLPFSDHPRKPWPKFVVAIAVAVLLLSWAGYELTHWQQKPGSEPAKAAAEAMMALPLPQAETVAPPSAPPAAKQQEGEAVPLPLPAAAPAQAPAPESAPVVGGKRLDFTFDGDSWVEVRDKSGKIVFSQLNPKGSQQSVQGLPPLYLVVGNATHVKLSYNDKPVDLTPHTKVDVARLTLE